MFIVNSVLPCYFEKQRTIESRLRVPLPQLFLDKEIAYFERYYGRYDFWTISIFVFANLVMYVPCCFTVGLILILGAIKKNQISILTDQLRCDDTRFGDVANPSFDLHHQVIDTNQLDSATNKSKAFEREKTV